MSLNFTPPTGQGRSLRIGKYITVAIIAAMVIFFVGIAVYIANLSDEEENLDTNVPVTITEHKMTPKAETSKKHQFHNAGAAYPPGKKPEVLDVNSNSPIPLGEKHDAKELPEGQMTF